MPDIKLSAGINFGKPETEFIVESTPQGVATSCRNVRTNTEYIGGGDGGDLELAELTIISNENGNIVAPIAIDDAETPENSCACTDFSFDAGTTTISIILFKGIAYGVMNGILTGEATGDVEIDPDYGELVITGDGTVTVTYS